MELTVLPSRCRVVRCRFNGEPISRENAPAQDLHARVTQVKAKTATSRVRKAHAKLAGRLEALATEDRHRELKRRDARRKVKLALHWRELDVSKDTCIRLILHGTWNRSE